LSMEPYDLIHFSLAVISLFFTRVTAGLNVTGGEWVIELDGQAGGVV